MQDQSKTAAGRRPSGATYDSAAMERQLRHVKGGSIAPAQVIASRIKPGSTSNSVQQNRSGVGASAATATSNQILKCPRCSSLNTKFCYYNNYSLLQPRHFCKNCRRYWTKGGALRNVPVGGGCRKNKRSAVTSTVSGSETSAMTAVTTLPSCGGTKQGSMSNMMSRENSGMSCRNSIITSAPLITSAVHKAALQESMPPPITHAHFPSLYNYTGKSSHIQPANSLSNPAASFYNPNDHSNLTQYPLLNPRLTPFLPPNQASFHSFLNLKQAISSLASPNHNFTNFSAGLAPSSALPFLSKDHNIISTANLDAGALLQAPINDPLMGLDLINASTTASLVPLSSVTTTHSTTSPTSIFNNPPSSLALQEGFNHTGDQPNHGADHQLNGIMQSHGTDKKKMHVIMLSKDQQELLQPFGSSLGAASNGLQEMHAGASIMEEGQLMQLMSSSSMKDELVSDNFKMKGDDDQPAAGGCCSNASWAGAQRSSFLEASGDDQPYWSCNPSTWPDDLST